MAHLKAGGPVLNWTDLAAIIIMLRASSTQFMLRSIQLGSWTDVYCKHDM